MVHRICDTNAHPIIPTDARGFMNSATIAATTHKYFKI